MPASSSAFLDDSFAGTVRLAVFGKHPAAADHLEDMGLSSASLVAFKQGFYIDGIGGSLAKQTWHKDIPSADSLPYNHHLLCVGRAGWVAARFTHSSDATGRRQYPFVVAVHGRDTAVLMHARSLMGELDALANSLSGLKDIAALRQAHAQAQTEWEAWISKWTSDPIAVLPAKESWLSTEALGPEHLGLQRIAHALLPQGAGAGRARVPLSGADPDLSLVLWLSFAQALLDQQVPVLTLIRREGESFGDLVLGPPGARALTSLFAGLTSQPLTSSVPFNLAGDLATIVGDTATDWGHEQALFIEAEASGESSDTLIQRICSGFRSWLKS